jgi:hypothetical protein
MVRAAKLRLTVVVMTASFRWSSFMGGHAGDGLRPALYDLKR